MTSGLVPKAVSFQKLRSHAHSPCDILGLAETKLGTQKHSVVATCANAARWIFSFSRVTMSSGAISYTGHYKSGGTALIAAGSITGRIYTTFKDPMGRWSAISLIGAHSQKLTVISAYQVCNTRPDRDIKARCMAAVTQQQAMINFSDPMSSIHPITKFRIDLLAFVQERQEEGHDIILMGDFNEAFGSHQTGLMHIASTCGLI
jgi:exonuclease III